MVAVGLDLDGQVVAHAEIPCADAAAATLDALRRVGHAGWSSVGIAALDPGSAAARDALAAVMAASPRPFAGGVTPAGTAAAVAEAWTGAARGSADLAYLALADHVSAGLVRGGVPVTGANGRAASVAWLALNPVEREDYRKAGCLEAEVSAAGIVRRLVWRIKAGDASAVQSAAGGELSAITLAHVIEGARARDGVSISVMRDTAKYVGMAAANLVVIADPEVLVLGGILAESPEILFDLVKIEIARRLPEATLKTLTIVPGVLGVEAAAIGAARLAAVAGS